MKKSIVRLVLLLAIFGLSWMAAPSHAFPLCPYAEAASGRGW